MDGTYGVLARRKRALSKTMEPGVEWVFWTNFPPLQRRYFDRANKTKKKPSLNCMPAHLGNFDAPATLVAPTILDSASKQKEPSLNCMQAHLGNLGAQSTLKLHPTWTHHLN